VNVGATANHARFLPGQRAGHYESFFQRANHPTRPLAFWIRYTIFSPEGDPHAGVGELWAIVFDGESGIHVAVKREVPLFSSSRGSALGSHAAVGGGHDTRVSFARDRFSVRVDDAELGAASLRGEASSRGHAIGWDLRYRGGEAPVLLLPEALYGARLPRAKMLVGVPMAVFDGAVTVDGRVLDVRSWVGSQNHNWGSQHTDHYAWGQVCGFDLAATRDGAEAHEQSFLEVGTGRLKIGGIWTPLITQAVLRHRGKEHRASGLGAARASGSFGYFDWRFAFSTPEARVEGTIDAAREDFVGLAYANPPGGVKHCLNSKIATCALTVTHTAGAERGRVERLRASRRAAFEILTDDTHHGVPMLA
jgi:hypothetical protein